MRITHINYRPSENFELLADLIKMLPPLAIIKACDVAKVETPKSLGDLCFLKEDNTYYLGRYFVGRNPEPIIYLDAYTPPKEGWRALDK